MADYYESFDEEDLNDLENLEFIERRCRIELERNEDLETLDEEDFFDRYRFRKETVQHIVALLEPKLSSATNRNRALSASEQVLIALRFFANGNGQLSIGDLQGASQPAISRTVKKVAICLAEMRPIFIKLPQSDLEMQEISQKFYNLCGFPGVYGALDCTHIPILSPGGQRAETFRNRHGDFSLNVQTLSDTDLRIRSLTVRWPGSVHDSTIFDNSYLRAVLETEVPPNFHVLGDSGYPLRTYLMTPFLNPTNSSQRRFNLAQRLGRNVVERQYGLWKKRFGCLQTSLRYKLETTMAIVVATAILHNIAINLGDVMESAITDDDDDDFISNIPNNIGGISKRNLIVNEWF